MERFVDQDLTDAEFRECDLTRARLIGVVMQDAVIDGLVSNLVVNGVEVTAYVEAELDRRHPVRLLIRSDDPADLREGWRQLRADWAATIERLRAMPGASSTSASAASGRRSRRCATWSSCTTRGSAAAASDRPSRSPRSGWRPTSCPTRRSRASTGRRTRASTRCWPCATSRRAELEALAATVTRRGALGARAGARRARLAAVRPGHVGARVPPHGARRGVGAPRLLRARPRPGSSARDGPG